MLQEYDETFQDLDLEQIEFTSNVIMEETLPFLQELVVQCEASPYDMPISQIEDLIQTLVKGHESIYPRLRKIFDKKYISKLQTEFYVSVIQ